MSQPSSKPSPYESYDQQNLLLRDYLALDRTALANERTLLAYIRTALALAVVGGTMMHFLESIILEAIGMLFIGAGALIAIIGGVRFRRVHVALQRVRKAPTATNAAEPSD